MEMNRDMVYSGKWLDDFNVRIIEEKEFPSLYGKIALETPCIDYVFSKEQWKEFKEKVNSV